MTTHRVRAERYYNALIGYGRETQRAAGAPSLREAQRELRAAARADARVLGAWVRRREEVVITV